MIILALDLSTKSTGYWIRDEKPNEVIEHGLITQSGNKNYIERIYTIVPKILELIQKYNIKNVYCEEVQFGDTNIHTFKTLIYLQAKLVSEVYFLDPTIEFTFFQPSEHRSRVGLPSGRYVTRDQCKANAIAYVQEHYGIIVSDDEADAATIADAAFTSGDPHHVKSPKLPPIGSEPSAF